MAARIGRLMVVILAMLEPEVPINTINIFITNLISYVINYVQYSSLAVSVLLFYSYFSDVLVQ